MYRTVCVHQFESLRQEIRDGLNDLKNHDIEPMKEQLSDVNSRVKNGLSDLPGQVKGLQRAIWYLLVALFIAVVGGGFWLGHKMGQFEAKLDSHIETHRETEG